MMSQRVSRARLRVPNAVAWAGAAIAASALFVGIGVTSAAFTDHAAVGLNGEAGLGGRFDIALTASDGSTLVEATTMEDAAVLPIAPAATPFSKKIPLRFSAVVVNKADSTPGSLVVALRDPDPESDDVYAKLRFTVDIDGATVATNATADDFNALGARIDANPGEAHTVTLIVHLDESTPRAYHGRSTAIGIAFEGEATP